MILVLENRILMKKRYILIIVALTIVSISLGIALIHSYSRIQHVEKEVIKLKNELQFYADIPKNPLYEDYKKRISELIKADIAKIISEKPSLGGKWFVTKIQFIEPSLVSVEYEDGHEASVSHIRIIRPNETFRFAEAQ